MKLTKKQKKLIIEGHGAACSEWKGKIEQGFPKLFKKDRFKKGDWVYIDKASKGAYGASLSFGRVCDVNEHITNGLHYGLVVNIDGDVWGIGNNYKARTATPKEIEEQLIKEAKKRGFKKGARYIPILEIEVEDPNKVWEATDAFDYYPETDAISCGFQYIYRQGKWAEIVKTMTKKEAEEKLNCTIV
nr:hypothetical protein [uncultured Allomuricauda sp.]